MKKKVVGLMVLMMILFAHSVMAIDTPSGTSGTCTWGIDGEGNLVISPTTGDEGTFSYWGNLPPWYDYRDTIKTVSFEGTIHAQSCWRMFSDCSSMTSIDLTGLDTSSVHEMNRMFANCSSLTSIDVSSMDTSQVYNMIGVFQGCSSLVNLDLSSWNASAVPHMDYMFEGCTSLETLDISSFRTNNLYASWYVDYNGGLFHTFKNLPSLQTLIVGDEFVWNDYHLYDVIDIMDEYPEDWNKVDTEEYYTPEQFLGKADDKGGTYIRNGRTVTFAKVDDETGDPIEGAKFYLKNQWDEYVVSTSPLTFGAETEELIFTTDAEGQLIIPGLNRGRYFLYEKEPADGYENNGNIYLIEITSDEINGLQLTSEDNYELAEITSQDDTEVFTQDLTETDKTNQYQVNYTSTDTWISETTETAYWEDIENGLAVVYLAINSGGWTYCDKLTMKVSPRFSIEEINHSDELSYTMDGETVIFNTADLVYQNQYYIELVLQLKRKTHDGEWFYVFAENAFFEATDEDNDGRQAIPSAKLCELKATYDGEELETDANGAFIITNQKLEEPAPTATPRPTSHGSSSSSASTLRGKVVVKYINQVTGEVIEKETTLKGKVGDSYETKEKEIEGYTLIGSTENTSGTYEPEEIEVIYYYQAVTTEEAASGESVSGDTPSGEEVPTPTPTPGKQYNYRLKQEDDGHHDWYVRGYEDYTFRIDRPMTREEVATVFYRLTVVPERDIRQSFEVNEDPFEDVDKDRWSARPIAYMKMLGIMNGYPDGTFDPTKPITRAEFAQVIGKYAEMSTNHSMKTFQDVEDGYWASDAIQVAQEQGWIQGYEDGTFRPTQNITRVEIVTIVNRMLHRKLNTFYLDKVEIPVVDLDPNHWGYADVVEAIIEYDYELNEDGEENILRYRYPFHEDMSDVAYNDV